MSLASRLKRFAPTAARQHYHHLVSIIANLWYGRPSRKLVVIGVTGTDGKTTTASLIADVLGASGVKVGLSTSAVFQVAHERWLNETHLTMPGRFALQKLLRRMVRAGCQYAVIEMSSEGLAQYRHAGIDIDVAVITNVTQEHIESHGSFESYKKAKGQLFQAIIRGGDKNMNGKTIPKATVVNLDDPAHEYFLQFWAEAHYGTSLQPHPPVAVRQEKTVVVAPTSIDGGATGSLFVVNGHNISLPMSGEYNVRNALQAIAVGLALGLEWPVIISGLAKAQPIPGRGEVIDSGKGWNVVVDYALTPNALEQLYASLQHQGAKRIIGVFGAAGGGRDVWKRPELGKISAQYCDKIILTTDDPYDEQPAAIAAAIAAGVPDADKHKIETILDRGEAIKKAMSIAQPGDVVAVTGMGSETSMMVKGKQVEWSDVVKVKQLV